MATTYNPVMKYTFTDPGVKYVVLKVTNSATRGGVSITKGVNVVAPVPLALGISAKVESAKVSGPSVMAHESPDMDYDRAFDVRCRSNGDWVVLKEGQSSKSKCGGTGSIDRLKTTLRQLVRCNTGVSKFDFGAGTTHILRTTQGPYTRCRSIFKP